MARVTRAAAHLSLEEVKSRLKNDHRPWCRQRWLIIYNALIDPRPAKEIAKHCGASKATVHQLISNYNRLGVEVVETPGKGGRRHEYLTLAEEDGFLAPFFARAERGEIATAAEIQRAFEARIGQEVDDSTIYRLLHRHGWRKLMPRPRHPQATTEAQEQYKKKLCSAGGSGSCNTPSRRRATCSQNGSRRRAFRSHLSSQAMLGPAWHPASIPTTNRA